MSYTGFFHTSTSRFPRNFLSQTSSKHCLNGSTRASGMILDNYSLNEGLTTWTTTSAKNGADDEEAQGYSFTEQIVVGFILASLVLIAFFGNLLVIIAVFTDPVLKRKESNRFFVSLASADTLVALLVMTFALIKDVHGRWEFGATFCLIWVCFDITCSTASILSLCIICVDRYVQITRPMHYVACMTKRKINILIVVIWLISAFLAFVPLHLGWHLPPPDQRMPVDPHLCILDISFVYAVASSSISFYIPCIIMLCLYLKIFLLTRRHVNDIMKQSRNSLRSERSYVLLAKSSLSNLKGTITLGVIVGVFISSWLPFFIINPIAARCATCIAPIMFQVFTWMGWANSCANPVIYSLLNRDFRNAFCRKLLVSASDFTIRPTLVSPSMVVSNSYVQCSNMGCIQESVTCEMTSRELVGLKETVCNKREE